MAAREIVDGEQEIFADGHIIRFAETFPNFLGSLPCRFERSFTFECNLVPTSWSIQLTFERLQAYGSVSYVTNVQTNDIYALSCYTNLEIRVMRPLEDIVIGQEHLTWPGLIPNDRESRVSHNFIPAQVVRELGNGHVSLQVSFRVRGCHRIGGIPKSKEYVSVKAKTSAFLSNM